MFLSATDLQEMIETSVLDYLRNEYDFVARHNSIKAEQGINPNVWQNFAEMGWLGLPLSEEEGGIGGGPIEAGLLMRAFGKALVVEPYLSCVLRGTRLFSLTANDAQKALWLDELVAGTKRLVLAHEERFESAPFAARKVTACAQAGGYSLNGEKVLVAGAQAADALIVTAELDGQTALFLVPTNTQGVTLKDQHALDSIHSADVILEQVTLSQDALLGASAQHTELLHQVLAEAMIAQCWEAVGAMQAAVEQTAAYTQDRHQFGKSLSSFQVVQHRLAEMAVAYEDSLAACQLASLKVQENPQNAIAMAALARSRVGRSARDVAQSAVQLHGAMGVSEELIVASIFRKLLAFHQQHGITQSFSAAYGQHMLNTGNWRYSQVLPRALNQ